MSGVGSPADQAADSLNNLSVDSQSNAVEASDQPDKKPSDDASDSGNGDSQPLDRSQTPGIPNALDPAVFYYPNNYATPFYYYGGYDGATIDWDYSRYLNPDGNDMSNGGPFMYPGYGYAPYGPYSSAGLAVPTSGQDGQFYGQQHYQGPYSSATVAMPTSGQDGQYFGPQHYQYPSQYFSGPYSSVAVPPIGFSAANQPPVSVDTTANTTVGTIGVNGNTSSANVQPIASQGVALNETHGMGAQNVVQVPRAGFDGVQSPVSWLGSPIYSDGQPEKINNAPGSSTANNFVSANQSPDSSFVSTSPMPVLNPIPMPAMNPIPVPDVNTVNAHMNMYPNRFYGQYQSPYGSSYSSQSNRRGWVIKGRHNSYSNENGDGLNELNRGPRARFIRTQRVHTPVAATVKEPSLTPTATDDNKKLGKMVVVIPDREQYNLPDFPETYEDAKFFVIKSYSEDDIHKSIKYNVWSSTENGNKKLEAAFQEAQQKSGPCPVFLFFSVNASGQFVGVAEMVGPVDFEKSLEYWQQDKWIGSFPVKWHIVKDVPNTLLKHIILEYNENKPVTNSRDTQEVKLEEGLEMLKIFKDHISIRCILDDFEFYEVRQKRIQEKKAKQKQLEKQASEENSSIVENKEEVLEAPPESAPKEATPSQPEVKLTET